ncbi:MAG: hypothetical protein KA998_00990 [Rickettsiaceae bacterium]|nr:hypothetical protein [Rickettsiaceae bacterium]
MPKSSSSRSDEDLEEVETASDEGSGNEEEVKVKKITLGQKIWDIGVLSSCVVFGVLVSAGAIGACAAVFPFAPVVMTWLAPVIVGVAVTFSFEFIKNAFARYQKRYNSKIISQMQRGASKIAPGVGRAGQKQIEKMAKKNPKLAGVALAIKVANKVMERGKEGAIAPVLQEVSERASSQNKSVAKFLNNLAKKIEKKQQKKSKKGPHSKSDKGGKKVDNVTNKEEKGASIIALCDSLEVEAEGNLEMIKEIKALRMRALGMEVGKIEDMTASAPKEENVDRLTKLQKKLHNLEKSGDESLDASYKRFKLRKSIKKELALRKKFMEQYIKKDQEGSVPSRKRRSSYLSDGYDS